MGDTEIHALILPLKRQQTYSLTVRIIPTVDVLSSFDRSASVFSFLSPKVSSADYPSLISEVSCTGYVLQVA